jgi:hypothetical protein
MNNDDKKIKEELFQFSSFSFHSILPNLFIFPFLFCGRLNHLLKQLSLKRVK